MSLIQTLYANNTVSMADLRRNTAKVIEFAKLSPIAVLNHNKPVAYLISTLAYKEMLQQIEDAKLN
jgi:antitoxin StbD